MVLFMKMVHYHRGGFKKLNNKNNCNMTKLAKAFIKWSMKAYGHCYGQDIPPARTGHCY